MAGGFLKFDAAKSSFFDRDAVMRAVDKGVRKQLGWFGAYCRRVAMNSIKNKPGASRPGEPPHAHYTYTRKHFGRRRKLSTSPKRRLFFRDSILYSLNPRALDVVIGPVLISGQRTNPTIPEVLEKGGAELIRGGKANRMLRFRARPFMHPAFDKTTEKFRQRLKGCVTK